MVAPDLDLDWPPKTHLLLLQEGGGDDILIMEAWNHIGDYYADRQKWTKAVQYYGQAKNYEKLVEFYYLLEDYRSMEKLIDQLPEGSSLLVTLAHKFASVGFSSSAVASFLKGGEVKAAVDCCVELNQWDQVLCACRCIYNTLGDLPTAHSNALAVLSSATYYMAALDNDCNICNLMFCLAFPVVNSMQEEKKFKRQSFGI